MPPHPLGGPQPAFCDLEEHNALTAHQERQRLATKPERRGGPVVADEAYRAVFLRVHPTGKMVLQPDHRRRRQGARVRAARRPASSACRRSTSRSSPPTPTASAWATATTRARPAARPRRSRARRAKIRDKARLLAGMALDAAPDSLEWANGAWTPARRPSGQDDRGRRALRARHRRAAAGRRGRARRADGLPRLTEVALEHDLDLVEHLQRAEQRRVRLHAPVGLA